MIKKLMGILRLLFIGLDLAWFGYLITIILFDSNDDRTFFVIVLFLFLMAVISIPYFISQLLIWCVTNILLTYKLRCIPKLCMFISLGIAVLLLVSDILITFNFELGIFIMDTLLYVRFGGIFVSLMAYVFGKCLTLLKKPEQVMSETRD